jgi:hypothetical protein
VSGIVVDVAEVVVTGVEGPVDAEAVRSGIASSLERHQPRLGGTGRGAPLDRVAVTAAPDRGGRSDAAIADAIAGGIVAALEGS